MPERPPGRLVGGLGFGVLLGALAGWVAGLLRVPRRDRGGQP